MPVIAVDQETHDRLKGIAEKLGMTVKELVKLLAFSTSIEESEEEVVLLFDEHKLRKRLKGFIPYKDYQHIIKEIGKLKEENEKLKRMVERKPADSTTLVALKEDVSYLKRELNRLKNEVSWLKVNLARASEGGKVEYPSTFVEELVEHGLLEDAQKFLRGESDEILEYINEDACYMLLRYKDEILSQKPVKGKEKKPLDWIC